MNPIEIVIDFGKTWIWGASGLVAWLTTPFIDEYLPGIGRFFFTPLMFLGLTGLVFYLAVAIVKWLFI